MNDVYHNHCSWWQEVLPIVCLIILVIYLIGFRDVSNRLAVQEKRLDQMEQSRPAADGPFADWFLEAVGTRHGNQFLVLADDGSTHPVWFSTISVHCLCCGGRLFREDLAETRKCPHCGAPIRERGAR